MSDNANGNSAPMGNPAGVAAATNTALSQAGIPEGEITGEMAKAMVEAEKAAKAGKAGAPVAAKPAAPSSQQTIKEAAAEARKYKVKVDGQDLEVDEAELTRGYAHQRAANKKLQEGLSARKQAEEFISMMKDPEKFYEVARKLGHDPRDLSEKYLARQLEDEYMDPRDKELRDTKAQLQHIKDLERRQQEAVESQRNEALKQKFAKDYSDQFVAALQETGLPPTKPMVAEMAKYISQSAKLGFKMTAGEAAQLVREDLQTSFQRLAGDSDGEVLLRLLGEDAANKIRKYDTAKLKDPNQYLRTPAHSEQGERREPKNPDKRMSAKEWREFNRKR